MSSIAKAKEWIKLNAPMLAVVYENKYVGMLYDRFGSLPPKQQKQVLLGSAAGVLFFIVLVLFSFYMTFWTYSSKASKAQEMVGMLLQYQTNRRAQEAQVQVLERNNQLATPDALKQLLLNEGRNANISPRLIKAEERNEAGAGDEDSKGGPDIKVKQATVKLERVNLSQLRGFLQNVEMGPYNLSISSLKITNDDKIRGYMNVELGVVAYLFQSLEEGQ